MKEMIKWINISNLGINQYCEDFLSVEKSQCWMIKPKTWSRKGRYGYNRVVSSKRRKNKYMSALLNAILRKELYCFCFVCVQQSSRLLFDPLKLRNIQTLVDFLKWRKLTVSILYTATNFVQFSKNEVKKENMWGTHSCNMCCEYMLLYHSNNNMTGLYTM